MSVLTTCALKQMPTSSLGLNPTSPAVWTYGSWVEALTAAAAGTVIAGLWLRSGEVAAEFEIDVGVGAAASETSIGRFRIATPSTSVGHRPILLPVPLGGIPTGARVAVRVRSSTGATANARVLLYYFEGFDGTSLTTLSNTPAGADGSSVTPTSSVWGDSAWVELTSGLSDAVSLYGVTCTQPIEADGLQYEVELGIGAGGSEVVIATMPGSHTDAPGPFKHVWFPKIYSLPASTRVAVRLRKSDTDITARRIALLYYNAAAISVDTTNVGYAWGASTRVIGRTRGRWQAVPSGLDPARG